MVQAGVDCVMISGDIFTRTLLIPTKHHLNATAYLTIVADHVHPFVMTVYPSPDGSRVTHHAANQLQQVF